MSRSFLRVQPGALPLRDYLLPVSLSGTSKWQGLGGGRPACMGADPGRVPRGRSPWGGDPGTGPPRPPDSLPSTISG